MPQKKEKTVKKSKEKYTAITPNGSVSEAVTKTLNKAIKGRKIICAYGGCLIIE